MYKILFSAEGVSGAQQDLCAHYEAAFVNYNTTETSSMSEPLLNVQTNKPLTGLI